MGLQRTISFETDSRPSWESVHSAFGTIGERPVVRMIDNLPAFPDEVPEPGWRELRISLSGGMVTIRTTPLGWDCVIWGTGEPGLMRSWNSACWAIATAGHATIRLEDGTTVSADEFRRLLSIPTSSSSEEEGRG